MLVISDRTKKIMIIILKELAHLHGERDNGLSKRYEVSRYKGRCFAKDRVVFITYLPKITYPKHASGRP